MNGYLKIAIVLLKQRVHPAWQPWLKNLDAIPKQDIASAVSKKGILFFYITDFNRDTKTTTFAGNFCRFKYLLKKSFVTFWQDIKTTGAIADEGGVKLSNGKNPRKYFIA